MKYDENGYLIEYEQQNNDYQSSWFLIVTYDILIDNRLNEFDKLMFAAITGMAKQKGYCWAPNSYFEKIFNKSTDRIIKSISKLVQLNYIKREIIYKKKRTINGKEEVTKEICWRKLIPILDVNNRRGGIENNTTGGIENNTEIDNKLIDNNSNFIINNKISAMEEPSHNKSEINDVPYFKEFLEIPEDKKVLFRESQTIPIKPAAPQKRKQGVNLAPYIDECKKYFDLYPEIYKALTYYIIAVNSCRAIWTLDEWKVMLKELVDKHSMKIPGTQGVKLLPTPILNDIATAVQGNGKEPYMYFGEYKEMEPQFNLNQDFNNQ